MNQHAEPKSLIKRLLRDQRGAILVMTTVYLPVIVGFFSLAVDMSYVYRTRSILQATADAAALAASMDGLPDAAKACSQAKTYATKNMDPNSYGYVLKQNSTDCSDVVVGMWSCTAGQMCSLSNFISDAKSPCGVKCNAVQVTTRMSSANGNALALNFAVMIGWSTINVPATAIATYGGTGVPWNVVLLQDVSPSFRQELSKPQLQAQNADLTLLNCMTQNAAQGSKLGIEAFATTDALFQAPVAVNDTTTTTTTTKKNGKTTTTTTTTNNNDTLTNSINAIAECGSGSPMPDCGSRTAGATGVTNIGGAIADSTGVLCSGGTCPNTTVSTEAIIIVTDGQTNSCGSAGCKNGQTPQTYAEAQANAAGNMGIDIYTICYGCGSTDASFLAKLTKGNGFSLVAPSTADIKSSLAKACASGLQHRLVW